jgi:hypothetical protein
MPDKPTSFELLEPRSPESLVPDPWLEPWMMLGAFLLLIVGLFVLLFFKKKPTAPLDEKAIRSLAHAEAAEALGKIKDLSPRETAVRCSLVLRRYLSIVARDPALFETHEEYISRHEALKDFTEEARQATTAGFSRLAAMKYSSAAPETDAGQLIIESQQLLETLHHGQSA